MRTAALFKSGRNQAVRLPKGFEFDGVSEVEIVKEGDTVILKPVRKSWASFVDIDKADPDFLVERNDLMKEGCIF